MPNRAKRPPIYGIDHLRLPKIEYLELDNGIPVHVINQGSQEVIKLEIIFQAGRPYEHKPLVAKLTGALLKEGSLRYPSAQLAEIMDYYGSSLKVPVDLDCPSVIVYTLKKHFSKILPAVADVLTQPSFPAYELDQYIERENRRMEVELSKTDVVAYRSITEQIFGSTHPYGYNSTSEMYQELNRLDLLEHFKKYYHAGSASIIISGKLGKEEVQLLSKTLGGLPNFAKVRPGGLSESKPQASKLHIPQKGALQTSIRLGGPLFARKHPQYALIYFINTLLGGYFGSRLMTNIREEKGFTYNIYSSIDCMRFDGSWLISSEVSNEHVEQTQEEILQEIRILQEELVSDGELEMVKNYIMGTLLSQLDGPFNVASIVKSLVVGDLGLEAFDSFVSGLQQIDSEQIREGFRDYLSIDSLSIVTVGP